MEEAEDQLLLSLSNKPAPPTSMQRIINNSTFSQPSTGITNNFYIITSSTGNNKSLYNTDRWNFTRGSTHPLSFQLEEGNTTLLASISNRKRLPITIQETSNTLVHKTDENELNRATSSGRSSRQVLAVRHYRNFPYPKHRTPIEFLHCSGTNEKTPNFGLHSTQSVFTVPALQDGGSTSAERNNRERRLYLQNRPQRHLCSSTYPQKFQKIFDISSQQYSLPVYLSSIRDKSSPTSIFKNNEICDRAIKEAGFENNLLSRRCLFITQGFKPTKTDMQGCGRTFNIIRLHDKLQEEHIYSFKNTGFLGFHI